MENTLGKRIGELRRKKGFKQDELAERMGVSPQAVSKWENDISCPDIVLLPELAKLLGVSIDELLTGKAEAAVRLIPNSERKKIEDRMIKILVDSADGDRVRVNLPLVLIETALTMNAQIPQVTGNEAFKNIDFAQILEMVHQGVVGNLIEVETADGDTVRVVVE